MSIREGPFQKKRKIRNTNKKKIEEQQKQTTTIKKGRHSQIVRKPLNNRQEQLEQKSKGWRTTERTYGPDQPAVLKGIFARIIGHLMGHPVGLRGPIT